MSFIFEYYQDDLSKPSVLAMAQTAQEAEKALECSAIKIARDLDGIAIKDMIHPYKVNESDRVILGSSIDETTETTMYESLAVATGIKFELK